MLFLKKLNVAVDNMKILHIADTHLGYSAYRKLTEEGINQREIDNYNAFKQVIDYAIQSKPDIILHAGDLFDSVRPNNRAITFAIKQILRLSKSDIPFLFWTESQRCPVQGLRDGAFQQVQRERSCVYN